MKQYLKNIAILGSLLFVIALVMDYGFTQVFKSGKTVKVQWLNQTEHQTFDYAIIGSSRAWWNINTHRIDSSEQLKGINLSNNHFGLSEILLRLKRFYANDNNIKQLYVQVDYKSIFSEPGEFSSTVYNYLPFIDDTLTYHHLASRTPEWIIYKYIPFWHYTEYNFQWGIEELMITKLNLRQTIFDDKGNFFTDNTFHGAAAIDIDEKNHTLNTDLIAIIEFCKTHGIELISFTAPYYQPKIAESTALRFNFLMDSLNIKHYDYSLIYSEDSTCFNDNTHLSLKGGAKFTDHLIKNHFNQNQHHLNTTF